MISRKISLLLLAMAAFAMQASRADTFRAVDPPQPVASGAHIEVIEFFYYACVDCVTIFPLEDAWAKQLPGDVSFRPVAIAWNPNLLPAAQAYHTLLAMGKVGELQPKIFQAIHVDHVHFDTAAQWTDWVTRNGMDRNKWTSVYQSAGIASKAQASLTVWKTYGADRAPSFVVDGKYYTDLHVALAADMLTGPGDVNIQKLLRVVDGLIAKARADRAAKKP